MSTCSCSGIFYKSTNVAVVGSNLVVTLNKTTVPRNLERVFFVICQNIPVITGTQLPVVLSINGVNYPLLTKHGNRVMSDQIVSHKIYNAIFGNNPNHFSLLNNCWLRCTRFVAPTVTAPAEDGGATVNEKAK